MPFHALWLPLLLLAQQSPPGAADCFIFYYGEPKDWTSARRCFEQRVANDLCAGSSPSLERLYLAVMYLDAQGGPADLARARSLFSGCFQDSGVQQVLDVVKSRESGQRGPGHSLDFCDDIGGTTFDLQACQTVREKRIGRGLTGIEKAVQGRLDAKGRDLYAKASETWKKFIQSDAKRASDGYRGGSLQSVAYGQRLNDLAEGRVVTLGKLFDYRPDPSHDSAQFAKADRSLNVAYQKASRGQDEEARKLLQEAERAWIAYRDAEASFYRYVFGPKFGDAIVEADVKTTLTLERSKKLAQKPD